MQCVNERGEKQRGLFRHAILHILASARSNRGGSVTKHLNGKPRLSEWYDRAVNQGGNGKEASQYCHDAEHFNYSGELRGDHDGTDKRNKRRGRKTAKPRIEALKSMQ
jgi:hypothetical protein